MNWYCRYLQRRASVQGEWWIIDGTSEFCDTDIGDWSHESYVVDSVASNYVDTSELEETVEDWFFSLSEEEIAELGITAPEAQVLAGGDAREYAMQELGWKRMVGNNIETWNLSSFDLGNIADGIWSAYDEESERETFNIEVGSVRRMFWHVPYAVIAAGNLEALLPYRG